MIIFIGITEDIVCDSDIGEFTGQVTSISDTKPLIILLESEKIRSVGYDKGIKFMVSKQTTIVNPNDGSYDIDDLQENMELKIFCNHVMTKSIPPITQANLIRVL